MRVHRGLALSHHQRGTNFAPCDVCGGPYQCTPSTSARVQNRFEFVELGRDVSSNCTKRQWDYRLVRHRRLVVPEVPLYEFDNIEYLQDIRAPPVCYVLVSRMYGYSYFHTWNQVLLLLLLLWGKCSKESRERGKTHRDKEGENARGTRLLMVVVVVVVVLLFCCCYCFLFLNRYIIST